MKSKILTLVIIVFCGMQSAISCPVWRVGKMYIIDENNKPVTDAIVWRYSNFYDSFKMQKRWFSDFDTLDSNSYTFWEGGGGYRYHSEKNMKPANKYLLIQAKGYADVIIKELKFNGAGDWGNEPLPCLYVKMYPKKYVRKGDLYTLLNKYVCEKKLEVTDSLTVDFDDYTESIREANMVANAQRVATYAVKTYPNPVKDKLNIEINSEVTKPYKATLLNVQGKRVSEMQLLTKQNVLDMEWEVAGIYFIQVFDPEGALLYAYKFIKT